MMRNDGRVAVSFFGEAATEEGVFHESINFAVLKKLPVVFACENNLYSVYSPVSVRQPEGREPYELARAYGLESTQVDGNDVLAVLRAAEAAVIRARKGHGPSFLEFKTYRWREHCGPNYDNDLGYRTEDEFQEWKARDPLRAFQEHLLNDGILSHQELEEMERDLAAEISGAFAYAKDSPFPGRELLSAGVYAP
jgi:pyruvate dehydrogenase E1 component alpha subunit